MTYDALRHFADSYGLVVLGLMFIALIGWTFRPGARHRHRRVAQSIFEQDERDD